MRISLMIVLCSWLGICGSGCTATSTHTRAVREWTGPKENLGRLVLLQQVGDVGREDTREEKQAQIAQLIGDAFARLPGTELVDAPQVHRVISDNGNLRAVSDYEAVLAAREVGADTVAMLIVDEYAGYVAVGLVPLPGWMVETVVRYEVRLLDVATGRVIADVHRHRRTGGYLSLHKPATLSRDFEADLAELLAVDQPLAASLRTSHAPATTRSIVASPTRHRDS